MAILVGKKTDHKDWAAQKLNVELGNGYFLFADGGITFDDMEDLPGEPIRIDIAGIDSHVINDFFRPEEPVPFLEEPWETIGIEQKLSYEKELRKELGQKHPLHDFECAALCKHQACDDVLFVSRKAGSDKLFAVVHLTWRGYIESEGYPTSWFYNTFDDFRQLRMYPDKADWDWVNKDI